MTNPMDSATRCSASDGAAEVMARTPATTDTETVNT
jgi:hypothetical protein